MLKLKGGESSRSTQCDKLKRRQQRHARRALAACHRASTLRRRSAGHQIAPRCCSVLRAACMLVAYQYISQSMSESLQCESCAWHVLLIAFELRNLAFQAGRVTPFIG